MSTHTQSRHNSPLNKKFRIAESEYSFAPRPPIMASDPALRPRVADRRKGMLKLPTQGARECARREKDNLNSPRFGGFRGHYKTKKIHFDLFYPLRLWVNNIEVHNDKFAHFLCNLIPCSCPFERDVTILGKTLHIPPLCKINPLYNEVVSLRLRALSYLEGDCGEDITKYIC